MNWESNKSKPILSPGIVHIWRICLDREKSNQDHYFTLLDDKEKSRARSFRFDKDKEKFITTHGILRLLCERYVSIPGQDIIFKKNNFHKPYIDNTNIEFNLSHKKKYGADCIF